MSFTVKLNENNGFSIKNGSLELCSKADATLAFVKTRLGTELGEWLYDNQIGIDFYSENGIFQSNFSTEKISALIRREILDVAEVSKINSFRIDIDSRTREYQINAAITTINNEKYRFIKNAN